MSQIAPCSTAQVKAVFRESILQFDVAALTPLAELCKLLTTFGRGHGELLLVEVRCPSPSAEETARDAVSIGSLVA